MSVVLGTPIGTVRERALFAVDQVRRRMRRPIFDDVRPPLRRIGMRYSMIHVTDGFDVLRFLHGDVSFVPSIAHVYTPF